MKLLLDENLPKRLKEEFLEFDISTVVENGWAGKKNGELLQLMFENNYSALLTFDKNLQFQQNIQKFPITVFVISAPDNTFNTLKKLMPKVKERLRDRLNADFIVIEE